jgi:hypothetical protein
MKLDKRQRDQLQKVITDPDFAIVEYFLQELGKDIGVANILNTTEWDFVKSSLQKEFQMDLLAQLPRLMEDVAAQGDEDVARK